MGLWFQGTQNAWNQRELGREDTSLVGEDASMMVFFLIVCSLLPDLQPAAKAECVQLSILKWQVSRILDTF